MRQTCTRGTGMHVKADALPTLCSTNCRRCFAVQARTDAQFLALSSCEESGCEDGSVATLGISTPSAADVVSTMSDVIKQPQPTLQAQSCGSTGKGARRLGDMWHLTSRQDLHSSRDCPPLCHALGCRSENNMDVDGAGAPEQRGWHDSRQVADPTREELPSIADVDQGATSFQHVPNRPVEKQNTGKLHHGHPLLC